MITTEDFKRSEPESREQARFNIKDFPPIISFDTLPDDKRAIAIKSFDGWQNYVASIGANNSLQKDTDYILKRLTYQECSALATDTFIGRAISITIKEMFNKGGEFKSSIDNEMFNILLEENKVLKTVKDVCLKALEFGGAFIYISTTDTDTSTPLYINENTTSTERLLGFRVIEPWQVAPMNVNSSNPLSDDYMQPKMWWVMGGGAVHSSRLIPVEFFPVSYLYKPLFNYLGLSLPMFMKDYVGSADTMRQSLADIFLRFRTDILKTTANKIADTSPTGMNARAKFINQTKNNLGIMLLTSDEDYIQSITSLAGLSDILSQATELMAATSNMPVSKLLGLSPRGFNATGEYEDKNHKDNIQSYQNNIARPIIEKLAQVVSCFKLGVYRSFTYEFNALGQVSVKESAEIRNLDADYIKKLVESNVLSNTDAIEVLQSGKFDLSNIDLSDYEEAEEDLGFDDEEPMQATDKFNEGEHKRDNGGKFANGGGGEKAGNKENSSSHDAFGTAYSEYSGKPAEAINKLLAEKQGYVPAAFHKEGIGDIDLAWGNDDYGLKHIIKRRNQQGINGEEFIKKVPEIVEKGKVENDKSYSTRKTILLDKNKIVIDTVFGGKKQTWMVTGFIIGIK